MYPEITYTRLIIRKSPTLDYASPLNDIKGWVGIYGIQKFKKILKKSRRPRHIFLHFRMITHVFFTGLNLEFLHLLRKKFVSSLRLNQMLLPLVSLSEFKFKRRLTSALINDFCQQLSNNILAV